MDSLLLEEGVDQRVDPKELALAIFEDKGVRAPVENKYIWLARTERIMELSPSDD